MGINKIWLHFLFLAVLVLLFLFTPLWTVIIFALTVSIYYRAYEVIIFSVFFDLLLYPEKTGHLFFGFWTVSSILIFLLAHTFRNRLF